MGPEQSPIEGIESELDNQNEKDEQVFSPEEKENALDENMNQLQETMSEIAKIRKEIGKRPTFSLDVEISSPEQMRAEEIRGQIIHRQYTQLWDLEDKFRQLAIERKELRRE